VNRFIFKMLNNGLNPCFSVLNHVEWWVEKGVVLDGGWIKTRCSRMGVINIWGAKLTCIRCIRILTSHNDAEHRSILRSQNRNVDFAHLPLFHPMLIILFQPCADPLVANAPIITAHRDGERSDWTATVDPRLHELSTN
jgi:hypothetical protein